VIYLDNEKMKQAIESNASCVEVNKYFNSDLVKSAYAPKQIEINDSCKINCAEIVQRKQWDLYINYANKQEDKVNAFIRALTEKFWNLMGCQGVNFLQAKKIKSTLALLTATKSDFKADKPSLENALRDNKSCVEVNKFFTSDLFKTHFGVEVNNSCKINCGEMNEKKQWELFVNYANKQEDKVKAFINAIFEKSWSVMGCEGVNFDKFKKVKSKLALLVVKKFEWKAEKPDLKLEKTIEKAIKDNASCDEVNKFFNSDLIKTYFGVQLKNTCKINCVELNRTKNWPLYLDYANKQEDKVKGFLNGITESSSALTGCDPIKK